MAERPSKLVPVLKKLGASLASIVVVLLVFELGFRLFYTDDTLTLDLDNELYWFPRPSQKTKMVTINSVGLRGPETPEKDRSKYRILTTGDSFTFGDRVKDDESYPWQLNELFHAEGAKHPGDNRPVEVLNGGGPGWGIFQMERYLRRAIPRYQPDVVFLTITPIDIYRQPFTEDELAQYVKLQTRRKKLRDTSVFLTFMARRVARMQLGKHAVPNEREAGGDKTPLWDADSARIKKLVDDFSGQTKFVLLVLYDFSQEHDWVAEHVKGFADQNHLDFFDLGPTFAGAVKDDLTVVGDGHPNKAGHAKVARALADFVYSKQIAEKSGG